MVNRLRFCDFIVCFVGVKRWMIVICVRMDNFENGQFCMDERKCGHTGHIVTQARQARRYGKGRLRWWGKPGIGARHDSYNGKALRGTHEHGRLFSGDIVTDILGNGKEFGIKLW